MWKDNAILFQSALSSNSPSIIWRAGSGLITLRGLGPQPRARFRVSFGGNIAIPTGGTVEAISLAIAIDGEPVASTKMIVTPAAVEEFFNISRDTHIDVPAGCCSQVSVENTSSQDVLVENANLIVERVA